MDEHETNLTQQAASTGFASPGAQIGTHEHLLTLAEATRELPSVNGKRHSAITIWRWCRKGIRGVRLEYIRIGRAMMTSREALNRFYRALAQSDPILNYTHERFRRPRHREHQALRQRQIEAAKQRLKEAGL